MRVVVQRVSEASVRVEKETTASIGPGLLVLLGIESADTGEDGEWLASKVARLRLFDVEGSEAVRDASLIDTGGDAIVVSQFTLHASTKKGTRPSYHRAAPPAHAIPLYEAFIDALSRQLGKPVGSGRFGAHMTVSLVNDGPVTLTIDSRNRE